MEKNVLKRLSTIGEILTVGQDWLEQFKELTVLHKKEQYWESANDIASLLQKSLNNLIEEEIKQGSIQKEKPLKYQNVTITKNKNCDTWYARKRVKGHQYTITGRTQIECYNNLREFMSPKNISSLSPSSSGFSSKITFDEWFPKWIELYKSELKEDSLRMYKTVYNKVPEEMKKQEMKKINLQQLLTFINSVKSPKNRQQVRVYDVLSCMFEKAVDNEIIKSNPLNKIDRPKYIRTHSEPLTFDQQEKLIDACKKVENSDFLIFSMFQGTRKGEVLGLTRKDIDFDNLSIKIDKAFKRTNIFGDTKNNQSKRICPLFNSTLNILEKYKNLDPDARLFNLSNKMVETIMKKVNAEFGERHIMIKDMRSTFITNCFYQQIPKVVIQGWVGHNIGSSVTESTYTAYLPKQNKEFIDRVNEFNGIKTNI